MEQLGLEPAFAGGSWDQPVEIVGEDSRMPKTWTFDGDRDSVSFEFRSEYMGASGVQQPSVSIDRAEVVFVGYGIQAPEEGWDELTGVDLNGKILLMFNDDPDWDPDRFAVERKPYYGRWTYKYESAGGKAPPGRSSSIRRHRPATRVRWSRAPGAGSSSLWSPGTNRRRRFTPG
jgi:hypothetical protein